MAYHQTNFWPCCQWSRNRQIGLPSFAPSNNMARELTQENKISRKESGARSLRGGGELGNLKPWPKAPTSLHINLNYYILSRCETMVLLVWNSRPKKVMQHKANPSLIYTNNVKAHKLQYEMRKCKGDEQKQTLDTKIYLVVSLGTKPPLVHVVEALYREYYFLVTKSLSGPSWLTTNSCQITMVTLASGSTKELLHEGWGSPCPPHKVFVAAPNQAGGLMTCQRATKTRRMVGAPRYNLECF